MTLDQKLNLVLANQYQLYHLVIQIPGVATYVEDIEHFENVGVVAGVTTEKEALDVINNFRRSDGMPPINKLDINFGF